MIRPRHIALACLLLIAAGCAQSVPVKLYEADRAVSLAARGVTAYVRTPGVTVAPAAKNAIVAAGIAADRTLDAAHGAVDAANKAGVEPGSDAVAMIDAALKIAETITQTLDTLKGAPHADH